MPFNVFSFKPWLSRRQHRLLDNAYRAAQEIRALEEKYFNGGKIEEASLQNKTVTDYVKDLRDRQLFIVRTNLVQFRLNGFLLNRQQQTSTDLAAPDSAAPATDSEESTDVEAEVLAKLSFIDSVVSQYRDDDSELEPLMAAEANTRLPASNPADEFGVSDPGNIAPAEVPDQNLDTGRGRRSRFLGVRRRRVDPAIEAQRIQEQLRLQRKQRQTALRWIIILIIVPFIVALFAKNFIFNPILGNYGNKNPTRIELSEEIKEEFSQQLTLFKEEIEVKELLGVIEITPEEKQEQLSEKASELWRESKDKELNGLKNVLADSVALLVFAGLVFFNRNKLTVIRNFSNQTFLNLGDPVKVFLFILVTDLFVGFHSAEGWETILVGIENHFGLPENEAAINLFIATIPVIMDSFTKFWIFSYLTRYSPSASAIYERMNT